MNATRRRRQPVAVAPRRLDTDVFRKSAKALGAETVDEMAALFGVHRSTIFRWFGGQCPDQALFIADTLGVKVDKLFPPNRAAA